MEESTYHLDLALDLDIPIVFAGAQRRPDEVSARADYRRRRAGPDAGILAKHHDQRRR